MADVLVCYRTSPTKSFEWEGTAERLSEFVASAARFIPMTSALLSKKYHKLHGKAIKTVFVLKCYMFIANRCME